MKLRIHTHRDKPWWAGIFHQWVRMATNYRTTGVGDDIELMCREQLLMWKASYPPGKEELKYRQLSGASSRRLSPDKVMK